MKRLIILCGLMILVLAFHPQRKTWVAIGDSITYLNDHQNETGNRLRKGYLTRTTDKLSDLEYVNKGYNGWTARRIAEHFDELNIPVSGLYSVFLGTNDWWAGLPIGTMADYKENKGNISLYGSMRIIVDKIHQLNPSASIVLITPMQRSDFVYINDPHNNAWGSYKEKNGQSLETFADAVKAIGKAENILVLDLYHDKKLDLKNLVRFKRLKNPDSGNYYDYPYPQYEGIPFNPDTDEYPYPPAAVGMTYDGLHPSDAGCEVIAGKLAKCLKELQ